MIIPNPAMFFGILYMKNPYREYEEEYEEEEEELYFEGFMQDSATSFSN